MLAGFGSLEYTPNTKSLFFLFLHYYPFVTAGITGRIIHLQLPYITQQPGPSLDCLRRLEVLVCTEIIRGCVEVKSCSLREEKGILELHELKRFSCSWRGTKDVKHYSHIIFKYQRRFPLLAVKSFHLHFQSVGVNWGSEVSDESCMICVNQPCRFLSHLHPELKCASISQQPEFLFLSTTCTLLQVAQMPLNVSHTAIPWLHSVMTWLAAAAGNIWRSVQMKI